MGPNANRVHKDSENLRATGYLYRIVHQVRRYVSAFFSQVIPETLIIRIWFPRFQLLASLFRNAWKILLNRRALRLRDVRARLYTDAPFLSNSNDFYPLSYFCDAPLNVMPGVNYRSYLHYFDWGRGYSATLSNRPFFI